MTPEVRGGPSHKGRSLLREGRDMRFAFIATDRGIGLVVSLCEAPDVLRSGFHAWPTPRPSDRARSAKEVGAKVRARFIGSNRTYGARRVWRDVLADGFDCGSRPSGWATHALP